VGSWHSGWVVIYLIRFEQLHLSPLRFHPPCCRSETKETEFPDLTADGTRVTKIEYTQCAAESKVVLYRIDGGGHTWPDGRQYLPIRRIGRTSRDINACDEIWEFFRSLK
jgi:poly(3-hydroxybutyrate) depolymerase